MSDFSVSSCCIPDQFHKEYHRIQNTGYFIISMRNSQSGAASHLLHCNIMVLVAKNEFHAFHLDMIYYALNGLY